MLDPVFAILIALSFALLFGIAAAHKWRDLAGFTDVLEGYGLLPPAMVQRLSWLIPLLETGLALGLLWTRTRAVATALGLGLLLGYATAIGVNLLRGRREIACGCGGPDQRRPIAGWMLGRNLVLTVLLGGALWPSRPRALEWTDVATILFGLAGTSLVYVCFDRIGLAAQRARALGISP
jgi:hypothetical protein